MHLWTDEFEPNSISELIHPEVSNIIEKISGSEDMPSIIFSGPMGAGKKTRIRLLLKEIYGENMLNMWKSEIKMDLDRSFNCVLSKCHIEVCLSNLGIYDRQAVQKLMSEISQTKQIYDNLKRKFKVLVIYDADKLSKDAMHSLRKAMERRAMCVRIIFCCESPSKIIGPLRSRMLLINVPKAKNDEIRSIVGGVLEKKGLDISTLKGVDDIIENSHGSIRKALSCTQLLAEDPSIDIKSIGWEKVTKEIAANLQKKTPPPKILLEVRKLFYELLVHCIPATRIIKSLLSYLIKEVKGDYWRDIVRYASIYEVRTNQGNKEIYHLEAFAAKVLLTLRENDNNIIDSNTSNYKR